MSRTCRAGVFNGREQVEIREFTVPDPPPGGAIVRVEAVGMCGSDVAQWHGLVTLPGMSYPIVPGHEIVGVIEQLAVDAVLGVREGDRVAIDEVVRGFGPLRVYGYTAMDAGGDVGLYGGYGEYLVVVPGTVMHRLTVDLPPEELTQFEPLASARNWVAIAGVGPGATVVVQGPGHQGLAVVQSVFAAGATEVYVTGTHRDSLRLQVATELGATSINVDEVDPVDYVRSITGGGADIVFDVTPVPDTVGLAIDLVRTGGTVLLAGLKERRQVSLISDDIVNRSLRVFGGTAFTPASLAEAVHLINEGLVDTKPLRGAVFGLTQVEDAVRLLLRSDPAGDAVRVSLRHEHH